MRFPTRDSLDRRRDGLAAYHIAGDIILADDHYQSSRC